MEFVGFPKNSDPIIESSLKMICSNILDRRYKVIGITSVDSSEGKSTLSANIAVTLHKLGKNVLIVDCDLFSPGQHELFGIENIGILESIIEDSNRDPMIVTKRSLKIQHVKLGLDLLAPGESSNSFPINLIDSSRITEMLDEVKPNYDYIIFDTPPMELLCRVRKLLIYIESMIVLIPNEKINVKELRNIKEIAEKNNINIMGHVLNMVRM